MSLAIFSCSPRAKQGSNTAKILQAFISGYERHGEKAEVYYLQEKNKWNEFRKVYEESMEMIFAIPLFVECIPGLMMEFLETLEPKTYENGEKGRARIAFILQGGFAEANQLRTGEHYLERVPGYLNCDYAGTLIKGDMFGIALVPENSWRKMVEPFTSMGEEYGRIHCFEKDRVSAFAAPEHFKKFQIFYMNIIFRSLAKMMFNKVSKSLGAKERLDAQPYQIQ